MDIDAVAPDDLLLRPLPGEALRLHDREYQRHSFDYFELGPADPPDAALVLERVTFDRCKVTLGKPRVYGGVELRTVEFKGLSAPDGLVVSTQSVLSDVKFSGRFNYLQVRPDEPINVQLHERRTKWSRSRMAEVQLAIDVSELKAKELEIIGVPLKKLRWNPEMHIAVRTGWREHRGWSVLLPKLSWETRKLLKRLDTFGCDEGVWQLPAEGTRAKVQLASDAEVLSDAGLFMHGPSI